MNRSSALWSLALASTVLVSCGKSDDTREATGSSSQLNSDSVAAEQSVAASFSEAMDSLSDGSTESSSASLALADTKDGVVSKSCAVDGDKAVVTLKTDRSFSWERTVRRSSLSMSSEAEAERTRTWSKEGTSLECEGESAAIDFRGDLTGYNLDVAIKRSVSRNFERKNLQNNELVKKSYSASVDGTRSIKWLSQTTQTDGSISRETSVSMLVNRSMSFFNKEGQTQTLALSIRTLEDAPLRITNIWDSLAKGRQLLSKEIQSGTIRAGKEGDATLEASFSDLKLQFSSSKCEVVSGQMSAKLFPAGATEAIRSYLLTVVEGEIKVQDVTDAANPVEIEDFEYSPCDLRDFQD